MKKPTPRAIPHEEVAQRRYEREAVRRLLPRKHWRILQILADGAEHRPAPVFNTLLDLIDHLAQPVVASVGRALELNEWTRMPTVGQLDHVIAEKAHVLYAAGISEEIVRDLIHRVATREEGSSYIHGVHHRLARRF